MQPLDVMSMVQIENLEKRGVLENTIIVFTSDHGMPFPRAKAQAYEYWKCYIYLYGKLRAITSTYTNVRSKRKSKNISYR